MPIILAAPLSLPPTEVLAAAVPMTWTGIDGSVWDLAGDDGRGLSMRPGLAGLHMPRFDRHKSSSPLIDGEELLGYSIGSRSVYWPFTFKATSQEYWRSTFRDFFASLHPVIPGTWTVSTGADARTLTLTYTDGDNTFGRDPFVMGWAVIGLELEAVSPLWRGNPVVQTFGASDGVDFIDAGKAPSFHISPAGTFSTASIENRGDEPAYPVWTVDGPLSTVQLGIGDALITVPFSVAAGSRLVIDTDPAAQFATLNGVDCTRELGFQMFAPVPAKGSTPLTILADGAGAVTVSLTPLFWRAF